MYVYQLLLITVHWIQVVNLVQWKLLLFGKIIEKKVFFDYFSPFQYSTTDSSVNLAIVPGSNPALPITISSVNSVTPINSQYYVQNMTTVTPVTVNVIFVHSI